MPFTPTHIVAILPLWPLRRWLPFPALAIGAMVPDIGLFFPIVDYAQTHSPLGVFTTCLPLGAAIFLWFETVLRLPLVALLPIWFQRRLDTRPQLLTIPQLKPQLIFYTGLVIAIVIGAFTHQIWDAFTHQGRWGTKLIPSLNTTIAIGGFVAPGFKLFQYGSTFVGMPLLVALTMISLRRTPPNDVTPTPVPFNLKILAVLVVCVTPLLVTTYAIATQSSFYLGLGLTVKLSGAIMIVLCTVYCAGFQILAGADAMHKKAVSRSTQRRGN